VYALSDGTPVLIRPIAAADKERLSLALARLSAETIHRRFLGSKPRLSSSELRYLTEVDGHNHIALVATLADDPDSIVAVARCVRLPDAPDTADFAIAVGDPLQGRGLGSLLARELAITARAAGIRRFSATMYSDNLAVRRLIRHFTATLEHEHVKDGLREVLIELAA
jgi:RimJ/RimL family protein N-acetyltransferase